MGLFVEVRMSMSPGYILYNGAVSGNSFTTRDHRFYYFPYIITDA